MSRLGRWALIDIETTGIDPTYDAIIDIGFLQFEGTKLLRKYSSLVQSDVPLSEFIQKLTGITQKDVNKAPSWSHVEPELLSLEDHHLIAHNSNFEKSFLSDYFIGLEPRETSESYQDSILYLSMLYPFRSSMKLESFIVDMGIADHEIHRGFEDSLDLLKVMLVATYDIKKDRELSSYIASLFVEFSEDNFWFKHFFNLQEEELLEIAEQIDFNLVQTWQHWQSNERDVELEELHHETLDFNGATIKSVLSDEESIQKLLPYYKFRKPQEDLALRVGQSFNNSVHSIIQAPTGTGKTLGYMIPSALFSMSKGEKVLISTGTKALQAQAYFKDVPLLKKLLGVEKKLKVAKLMGSGNHYCELKFRNDQQNGDLLSNFEDQFIKNFFDLIFYYNSRVEYDETVNRESIPFVLKRIFKSFSDYDEEYAVDFRSCTNSRCPFFNQCSYVKGLKRAKESHLIISNHSMTLGWPRSFERPSYIIVDEAHRLENEATRTFTLEIRQKDLEAYGKSLMTMVGPLFYLLGQEDKEEAINGIRKLAMDVMQTLNDQLPMLRENIEKFFKEGRRYTDIFWNESPMITKEGANSNLSLGIYNQLESVHYVLTTFFKELQPYWAKYNLNEYQGDDSAINAVSSFESFMSTLDDNTSALSQAFLTDETFARSIKFHEEYGFKLESSPVDVGKIVYNQLLQPSSAVVMTSATLGNSTGDKGAASVEWMTGYSYLPSENRFEKGLFLPEVYDVKSKAKVFVCTDVPSLYDKDYVKTVIDKITPTIKFLGGRTLLLFSARKRFDQAVEILLDKFKADIPVFIQGMGQNVVEDFKNAPHGILVGMESFGEGIDIPGDKLQFIVIDKVPDIRQDFVIQKRRDFYQANFGNEFNDYFLGTRTRALHQKLGRLLRTTSDYGTVIVTDSRLSRWKKRTLDVFSGLMEPYSLEFKSLDEACNETCDFISSVKTFVDSVPLDPSDSLSES
jgi:ATP-dependent DNA helicase DinG